MAVSVDDRYRCIHLHYLTHRPFIPFLSQHRHRVKRFPVTQKEGDMLYLCLVAKDDTPMYEAELSSVGKREGDLIQFIAHAALDVVEQKTCLTTSM